MRLPKIALVLIPLVALTLFPQLPDSVAGASTVTSDASNFKAVCKFSHNLGDDPIVAPKQPGGSHQHDFFGNTTTDAHSTTESLNAGSTTCEVLGIANSKDDDSPYWVPALSVSGKKVVPLRLTAYYNLNRRQPGTLKPWAHGFRVIAGNAKATTAQDPNVVGWTCQNARERTALPPLNCGSKNLVLHIAFADCWDGKSLDSTDHKSHVAYSKDNGKGYNVCPASHPVATPQLQLHVTYPITTGTNVAFSSGGALSGHADFWNTWTDGVLKERIDTCLNAAVNCR